MIWEPGQDSPASPLRSLAQYPAGSFCWIDVPWPVISCAESGATWISMGWRSWRAESQELLAQNPGLAASFDWVLMKAVAPPVEALRMARPFVALGRRAVLFRRQDETPDPRISTANWEWEGFRPLSDGSSGVVGPALQLFRRLT